MKFTAQRGGMRTGQDKDEGFGRGRSRPEGSGKRDYSNQPNVCYLSCKNTIDRLS